MKRTGECRIQLLLHCVDGCVPYLNPHQLEMNFPPSVTNLWLGLAVRDSSIAPIFNSSNVSDETERGKKNQSSLTKSKVGGYTFIATPPDPWLLPYTRITASSFGLSCSDNNNIGNKDTMKVNSSGNTSKNTNKSVYVWTPHGRQKLTADLYFTASIEGLKSQHTISLFDYVDEGEFSLRRKLKAERRNQEWFQHLSSRNDSYFPDQLQEDDSNSYQSSSNGSLIWKPLLLPNENEKDDGYKNKRTNCSKPSLKEHLSGEKKLEHVPSGIAFVGRWRADLQLNKIIDMDDSIKAHFDKIQWKSVLSTYSLSEILDIASTGFINVIGTNLPQKWAKEKLALGLDLSLENLSYIFTSQRNPKRQKMNSTDVASSKVNADITEKMKLNADGCMDMSSKIFARDPKPLVTGCECFVCKDNRFSRAYIHHLVVAKEMLAEILIFGHNLHSLLKVLQCFDSQESDRKKVNDAIRLQLNSS